MCSCGQQHSQPSALTTAANVNSGPAAGLPYMKMGYDNMVMRYDKWYAHTIYPIIIPRT